jgi:hypothetical protein
MAEMLGSPSIQTFTQGMAATPTLLAEKAATADAEATAETRSSSPVPAETAETAATVAPEDKPKRETAGLPYFACGGAGHADASGGDFGNGGAGGSPGGAVGHYGREGDRGPEAQGTNCPILY